ncbi:MAG: alpha/beta hydrolase [Alphaproteobacteria bacterium]|nr:alpha/beta hydrolase [Alphaproteobacteria bacterium]MDE2629524.1 alpha/beta hydrolase [Alphaproteobacteria bacterium]
MDGNIFCLDQGTGAPLLLVHGWALHGGFFLPQIQALCQRFRVIVPDLAGHGRSSRAAGPFTIRRLADDLHALLERLGVSDVLAVGWSMGAMVLWDLMARHGAERFGGLAVEDMTPRILNAPGWQFGLSGGYDGEADKHFQSAMRRDWAGHVAAFAPRICARGLQKERSALIERAAVEMAANAAGAMADLWASMVAQDYRTALRSIPVPALIAHGALSQLYPAQTAEYLSAQIPNAHRIVFPRSGHAPHLEEPERFNLAIEEFAASLVGAGRRQVARA